VAQPAGHQRHAVHLAHQRPVAQLGPLGPPGGARGVEDGAHARGVEVGRGVEPATAGRDVGHRPQHEGGVGIGHDVVDLVGPEAIVDRRRQTAGPADGGGQQELVVAVGGGHDDDAAGLDLALQGAGPAGDLVGGIGQGADVAPLLVDEHAAATRVGQAVEDRRQGQVVVEGETGLAGASQAGHHGAVSSVVGARSSGWPRVSSRASRVRNGPR
jgi:hypothetical protein